MPAPTRPQTQHWHDLASRRFPLVPHPKPACRPLTERIERVTSLASQADSASGQPLIRAAEACNLAALIASDCGAPSLARDLCWQQYRVFAHARISNETTAKLALQPLINLARLHIRDGDGDSGYSLLESLFTAVRMSQAQVSIDNQLVPLATLPGEHRKAIVQWLWTVLLSDGLRALCRAGRWTAARDQAQQHNGIGQRLLHGRQIAILAHITSGHHDEASQLLDQTTSSEPWEEIVAACLDAINRVADDPASMRGTAAQLADAYLAAGNLDNGIFTARLGLAVAELACGNIHTDAITSRAMSIAMACDDAYIAREVLMSPAMASRSSQTRTMLNAKIVQAGLSRPLTAAHQQQLTSSVTSAARILATELASMR
jgi:hypothetical protein